MESYRDRVVAAVRAIPRGCVATYGQIAALAGNPRGARQVVRTLHACSRSENLPWHRVVNAQGRISLPRGAGYEVQRALLAEEGVEFGIRDAIDLRRFRWTLQG